MYMFVARQRSENDDDVEGKEQEEQEEDQQEIGTIIVVPYQYCRR